MDAASLVSLVRCLLLFLPVALLYYHWYRKRAPFVAAVNKIPGPQTLPFIGNTWELLRSPEILFANLKVNHHFYGPVYRVWQLSYPHVTIHRARDTEVILRSMAHHVKGETYSNLEPWLGQGLLTSRGEMWRLHRKVLTPAFHFNILHEFLPIFNKHALKMSQCLAVEADTKRKFNVFKYTSLCSLDIICESSMGTKINSQDCSNSPYVNSVERITQLIMERNKSPWLQATWMYNMSNLKKEMDLHLKYLNDFTDQVIADRREYLKSVRQSENEDSKNNKKIERRSLAFLDLLLAAEEDGSEFMTQKDIRDQVSTFLFEGHDTVSTAMAWTIFLLASNPEHQERVVEELVSVFGDSGRAPDMSDLTNLKYLERCIKESLRLFPSVPFYARSIHEDAVLDDYVIPAGSSVFVNTYMLHRDPEYWPDPDKFNPDRFLPENSKGRHPYAYVPFSAGPRNCIGQKYALMEEKVVLSTLLRRYRFEPAHSLDDVVLQIGLILRPPDGLHVRLYERHDLPQLPVSDML